MYIVVKRAIEGIDDANKRNKKLTFKNIAALRSCISKFNNTFVDNGEDFDIVMTIENLLEFSDNYSMTSGSLWNYDRDEVNDDADENNDAGNYRKNYKKATENNKIIHTIILIH